MQDSTGLWYSIPTINLWAGNGWSISSDLETRVLSMKWTGDYKCDGPPTKRKLRHSAQKTRHGRKKRRMANGTGTSHGGQWQ
jgi:hypothetical protein